MARILRFYVIREVAVPTLMAILTITFILLISRIFELINLLLQPSVHVTQVLGVLWRLIPQLLVFAVPMAILIGSLIGVGRMTLDREIVATRASGINLFSIFLPGIVLALLISFAMMYFSSRAIPATLMDGMKEAAELQFTIINSLEPGRFHGKDELGSQSNFILYFRDRDPQTKDMLGVIIKLESDFQLGASANAAASDAKANKPSGKKSGAAKAADAKPNANAGQATDAETGLPINEKGEIIQPDDGQTMIFAKSGSIISNVNEAAGSGGEGLMVMTMNDGTLHQLIPQGDDSQPSPDYSISSFQKLTKVFVFSDFLASLGTEQKAQSNAQLRAMMDAGRQKTQKWGQARSELVRRYTISLASFVFALVGIPLAIWVRPSGKSWGILIAVSLMLAYYVLMQWGLTLVKDNKPLGLEVAYAPNVLFMLLGGVLWWQTLRS